MELNLDRVRANVHAASTEDLLDRATVYRSGMEPEAVAIIDEELHQRGVSPGEVFDHGELRREQLLAGPDGQPVRCQRCSRPAIVQEWRWHRLWGLLPVFPRWVALCEEHSRR
jgi:hypothetical protein